MEEILFPIIRKEPILYKWKDEDVKDEVSNFVSLYYGEFQGRFK